MMKLEKDKPNDVNEEILKQGNWMNKKLNLIDLTGKKLKIIREDNINTILN